MTWISVITYEQATDKLKALYERYKWANDSVANIIEAHSLRPHLMEGHMAFYRAALGHSANTSPVWFMEAVGVYVSALNGCDYCVDHHDHFGENAYNNELGDWKALISALLEDKPEKVFAYRELAILNYAKILTLEPKSVDEAAVIRMRDNGVDDGEILEVNQVVGYFSFANRTVLGLGITLKGEVYAD